MIMDAIGSFFLAIHNILDYGSGILFDSGSMAPEKFLVLTLLLGGAGSWSAGRSVAHGWSWVWLVPFYALGLTLGVRFLHYALFQGDLFSIAFFLSAYVILLGFGLLGYRSMRSLQMGRQYSFEYKRRGYFGWHKSA